LASCINIFFRPPPGTSSLLLPVFARFAILYHVFFRLGSSGFFFLYGTVLLPVFARFGALRHVSFRLLCAAFARSGVLYS
jgi:hypothetical protein